MKYISKALVGTVLTLAFFSKASIATLIISDDFETDLSQWTGKSGGAHSGVLVADPFNSANQVLSFTQLISGGDLFTVDTVTSATSTFSVEFDYLGLPKPGSEDGDLGGFFGISEGFPDKHFWVAGTGSFPAPIPLIDDGTWHHYSFDFTSPLSSTKPVHLMLEDFIGSGGVAGDIYFDNFSFGDKDAVDDAKDIPEPSTLAIFALGIMGLVSRRFKKQY